MRGISLVGHASLRDTTKHHSFEAKLRSFTNYSHAEKRELLFPDFVLAATKDDGGNDGGTDKGGDTVDG